MGSRTSLSTSEPRREPTVCNTTTPVRYFALVGQFDLLVEIFGGRVNVPRESWIRTRSLDGIAPLLSEIGQTERPTPPDQPTSKAGAEFGRCGQRKDIDVVDLTAEDLVLFAESKEPSLYEWHGARQRSRTREAAVIAIAISRGWAAVLDDAAARATLSHGVRRQKSGLHASFLGAQQPRATSQVRRL